MCLLGRVASICVDSTRSRRIICKNVSRISQRDSYDVVRRAHNAAFMVLSMDVSRRPNDALRIRTAWRKNNSIHDPPGSVPDGVIDVTVQNGNPLW